jgi:acyl-CoA thioesterase FadM
MNLLFRLVLVVVRALMARRIPPLGESALTLTVWPHDLDLNMHMNNGRYLAIMDLGRVDLMVRAGLLGPLARQRWAPVVGAATIRFRRPLGPFRRFVLRTRVVHWDDKWFYIEQRFERGGAVVAVALVRALMRGRGRQVRPGEVFALLGPEPAQPPRPPAVEAWEPLDAAISSPGPGR